MSDNPRKKLRALFLACAVAVFARGFGIELASPAQAKVAGEKQVIACRTLEVHALREPSLTAVVFHQRDEQDRERLAALLREHPQAAAEIQTRDSAWHGATVVRLKSCFGRGLLLIPAGTVSLAEKGEFLLRFSGN